MLGMKAVGECQKQDGKRQFTSPPCHSKSLNEKKSLFF